MEVVRRYVPEAGMPGFKSDPHAENRKPLNALLNRPVELGRGLCLGSFKSRSAHSGPNELAFGRTRLMPHGPPIRPRLV